MRTKTLSIIALMLTVTLGAMAQTNTDSRKVKRITFDKEQVNVEYTDGTAKLAVKGLKVTSDKLVTGVKTVTPAVQGAQRRWYTIDGRTMQREPRQKGVYIVREQNGMKKTIKK